MLPAIFPYPEKMQAKGWNYTNQDHPYHDGEGDLYLAHIPQVKCQGYRAKQQERDPVEIDHDVIFLAFDPSPEYQIAYDQENQDDESKACSKDQDIIEIADPDRKGLKEKDKQKYRQTEASIQPKPFFQVYNELLQGSVQGHEFLFRRSGNNSG